MNKVRDNTTYEEFLDIVFMELWNATEDNLTIIRRKFKYELEPAIIGLLNKLRADVSSALNGEDDNGLQQAITRATTEIQNSMEKAIEWFHVSKLQETPDAKIEAALEVGLTSINSYFPQHALTPEIEIDQIEEIVVKGKFFSYFSDIFFILFQNIKAHSGIEDRAPQVQIQITKVADRIYMKFWNELDSELDFAAIERKVTDALNRLKKHGVSEEVQREGGSGFPKIYKIFSMNMRCNQSISAEVKEGKFLISISFDAEGVTI